MRHPCTPYSTYILTFASLNDIVEVSDYLVSMKVATFVAITRNKNKVTYRRHK